MTSRSPFEKSKVFFAHYFYDQMEATFFFGHLECFGRGEVFLGCQ